ncbi:MAG TPA: hypothetical protein VJB59_16080 [Bdellovibrionota bacterium]|nr:hypothetical protein [Bdellovibrionota bacterium]
MGFPSKSELKKVRNKLKKAQGTLILSPNPTPLQKFRWDICQKFVTYKQQHDLT